MGRKRHTPEQIITALREAEVGLAQSGVREHEALWGKSPEPLGPTRSWMGVPGVQPIYTPVQAHRSSMYRTT